MTSKWPKNNDGENEPAAFLCHLSCNDMADDLLVNMLDAYGIPCIRKYPGDGSFGRVVIGMSGTGSDIYVPQSMLNDAFELYNKGEETEDGSVS